VDGCWNGILSARSMGRPPLGIWLRSAARPGLVRRAAFRSI